MYRQESTWFYEGAYNYNIGKYEKSKQTQLLSVGLWKANVLQSVLNVSTDVIGLNSAGSLFQRTGQPYMFFGTSNTTFSFNCANS